MKDGPENITTEWKFPSVDYVLLFVPLNCVDFRAYIQDRWATFMNEHIPNVPVILIGIHPTVYVDFTFNTIQAQAIASELNCIAYFECNPTEDDNVIPILEYIVKLMF
ncbi:hypothetical protein AABB24_028165 [Solanum stoloniferum]|uniref:Uncharacterized protein n=1 Tax=Solanum stoloniferum TaxID=62892 RepID=A0ABD2S935_9SOLN